MPDYSNSVIYTIRSKDNIYVGSTVDIKSRKHNHKTCITNENYKAYNLNLYKTIRENGGEWEMKPYSEFPCNSRLELTIEEERVRRLLNADLNMSSCTSGLNCSELSKKEYRKLYYTKVIKAGGINYRAQYIKHHRKEINKHSNNYYHRHKDKINEKALQKITCECGCIIARRNLSIHRKSQKHLKLLKT